MRAHSTSAHSGRFCGLCIRNAAACASILLASSCAHVNQGKRTDFPKLERDIRALTSPHDSALIAVSVIDLASGRELHINGDSVFHAASTMKVPVLLEVFNEVDAHTLSLDSAILVRNRFSSIADTSHYSLDIADDSDSTLYYLVGKRVPLRELTRLMIVRSSNLATNLLIDLVTPERVRAAVARVGGEGVSVLRGVEDNAAYQRGLNNTTTSRGMARVLAAIAQCQGNTRASCSEMLDILSGQEFNEMIPAGLPAGTRVAHKTGWITGIRHDAAIVMPPDRKPYVLVILTRGFRGTALPDRIGAQISRIVWDAIER